MAKNQNNTKDGYSQGNCSKFFKSFRRRISPARPLTTQRPLSSTNRDDNKPSTAMASASDMVLIEYNHSQKTNAKPMFNAEQLNKPTVNNTAAAKYHDQQNQEPKVVKFQAGYNSSATNENFSEFIDHVKKKIKATSTFVADENAAPSTNKRATTRRDSFNDRVNHFINRAKLKIRTTTIVGDNGGDHGDGKLQPYVPN